MSVKSVKVLQGSRVRKRYKDLRKYNNQSTIYISLQFSRYRAIEWYMDLGSKYLAIKTSVVFCSNFIKHYYVYKHYNVKLFNLIVRNISCSTYSYIKLHELIERIYI